MQEKPLDNYLRTYRKRAGLSQDEVAFLLGGGCGTQVSRYELGKRLPSLETALALEAILGVPVKKIFLGRFSKVDLEVRERAKILREKLQRDPKRRETVERLASLEPPTPHD